MIERLRLQPYLGPRAHLSLAWISQVFLSLILLAIALALLLSQVGDLVADGKRAVTAACAGLEGAANVAVSLPHYTSDIINDGNARAAELVIHGTATVFDLSLAAIKNIVIFIIDTYRSLLLCLLDFVVHGSLDLLLAFTEEAEEFVTGAFQAAQGEIQDAIRGINSGLEASIGVINRIPGVDIDVPSIDVPALTALNNVTLPSSILSSLQQLNDSIPTLDEVRAQLNSFISVPIEDLRTSVRSTLGSAQIDVELLPVPAKQTVDLCSGVDTSFVDSIGSELAKFVKICLVLIGLAMAVLVAGSMLWERYRYRSMLEAVARAREAWGTSREGGQKGTAFSDRNLLAFLSAANNPTSSRVFGWMATKLRLKEDGRAALFWFGTYVTHPAAIAFLAVGVLGLILIEIQLGMLNGPLRAKSIDLVAGGMGDFADQALLALNRNLNETSVDFATRSNTVIAGLQDTLNEDVFGWVNVTTTTMNSTVVAFYDGLTNAINTTFSGTPLQDPALDVIRCLIGTKVENIATALTWIHDNAHLTLPLVANDVFLLSNSQSSGIVADLNGPEASMSGSSIVDRMLDRYEESLKTQRLAYIICIAVWLLVLAFALVGLAFARRKADTSNSEYQEYTTPDGEKFALRAFHLKGSSSDSAQRPLQEVDVGTSVWNHSGRSGLKEPHQTTDAHDHGEVPHPARRHHKAGRSAGLHLPSIKLKGFKSSRLQREASLTSFGGDSSVGCYGSKEASDHHSEEVLQQHPVPRLPPKQASYADPSSADDRGRDYLTSSPTPVLPSHFVFPPTRRGSHAAVPPLGVAPPAHGSNPFSTPFDAVDEESGRRRRLS